MYLPTRLTAFAKRNKWKLIITAAIVLPLGIGIALLARPPAPEYVTAEASRGDLEQTVEAVGTVISEKDLDLQFRSSGIVSAVFVKEGDKVKTGERLAQIRAGNLAASVASAAARVQEMEASLRELFQGSRPEDIAVAEAELVNKRAALEAAKSSLTSAEENLKTSEAKLATLKQEADIGLSGQVNLVSSTLSDKLTVTEQALARIDDVFAKNNVSEAVTKDRPGDYDQLRRKRLDIGAAITALRARGLNPKDYEDAFVLLDETRKSIVDTVDTLALAYNIIVSVPETTYFTSTDRETNKTVISVQQTNVQKALSDLDASVKGLRDASATYDTRIASEESALGSAKGQKDRANADILTYESAVRIQEAQLLLKTAPARETDIAVADARLRQAKADLARASADYGDTIITAPVDGTITKVNVKVGEATPVGAAVTMLGSTPYRVEMFVSEVDVPRLQVTQTGSIELDAFPDVHYAVHVSEIDPSATRVEGVNKYRVKLDFLYPHDEFKIGMTGDVTVITGARHDVIKVPLRSVIKNSQNKNVVRVLKGKEITEVPVETGMEGESGDIEILSGLEGGETVVVLIK